MAAKQKSDSDEGRTMRVVAASSAQNRDEIIKASEWVDVRPARGVNMSLAARRYFNLMLKEAGPRIAEPIWHRMLKNQLRQGHKSNDHVNSTLDELKHTTVRIPALSGRGRPADVEPQIVKIKTEKDPSGDAWVEYQFPPELRELLADSKIYAVLEAQAVLAFRSKYSLALYEIGSLVTKMQEPKRVFAIDDLREFVNVPEGGMIDFGQFRHKVLEIAKAEINQLAHFTMNYEIRKAGRTVTHVILWFWPKASEDAEAAERETNRHSTGRKARREGVVERVEPVNPALPAPAMPPSATRPARGLAALEPLPGVDHERLRTWVKGSKSVAAAMATIAEARVAEASEPGAAMRMMSAVFAES